MLGPWVEVAAWFKSLLPTFERSEHGKTRWLRLPHFNFITLHYMYLIALTIICSIILYPVGNLQYIDCIFFGSGVATQSGLNTIDLNDLYLYQQITLYAMCMIATPVFINTFVVFVRLYWFEKRFQNVVLEAQRYRRTRERTRTLSEAKDHHDQVMEEKGVGNRKIVVMHPGNETMRIAENNTAAGAGKEKDDSTSDSMADGSSEDARQSSSTGVDHDHENDHEDYPANEQVDEETAETVDISSSDSPIANRRDHIAFVDQIQPAKRASEDQHPMEIDADRHIAFLEKQRNADTTGVLYIPGPRDFDKGYRPKELVEAQHDGLTRHNTGPDSPTLDKRNSFPLDGSTEETAQRHNSEQPQRNRHGSLAFLEDGGHAIEKFGKTVAAKVKFPSDHDLTVNRLKERHRQNEDDDESETEPTTLRKRGRSRTLQSLKSVLSTEREDTNPMPYLSYQATIGRNSTFVNLTEEQREELGGIEYRALKTLAITLCVYYLGYHLLAITCLTPWIVYTNTWGLIVNREGISRPWWGFFTSASLLNDLGYTLTPNSMISFQHAVWPLLLGSWLIIIGNTGFPCWLRFMIWIVNKLVPKDSSLWEEFRFLLDHPRRCFTLLFPSAATWWLFWVLVVLNGLDLIFFIVLDLNDPVVTHLPAGLRVLNGWFQAASTRTAGFAVVDLADLHPAIQVSYLIMMYISVFPIAISVRRTNVYEEKSLGIWGNENEEEGQHSYVGMHFRRQLSFDLWYIFLGLFIICIAEGDQIKNTSRPAFSIFSVLFEIVSAYGTVGLSLGYPGTETSFSAQFGVVSKLVIVAMQIRGRHRGLPYALDRAILLPSEEQEKKENENATRRRRSSVQSTDQPPPGFGRSPTTRSNWSASERQGRWKNLLASGLSAGPTLRKTRTFAEE